MLKIGLVGAGANTKARHIPCLRALPDVEIVAVCNRSPESSRAVAAEFGVPRVYDDWRSLVASPDVDAVVVGTWPNLHAPVTLAALDAGKHVLTEARMARDVAEARAMLAAARRRPGLVCQIVPSPFGLRGHRVMVELIEGGFLGELREASVVHRAGNFADPDAPLHWRQDAELSGYNMLTLGILHETLARWVPPPVRVMAMAHAFFESRRDAAGRVRPVGSPDSVQVVAELDGGARATYQLSGVTPYGTDARLTLFGSDGVLEYDLLGDAIRGTGRASRRAAASLADLAPVEIPPDKAGGWRVEADFVDSIRAGAPVRFTDFVTGVRYMEFTEAVARSAYRGAAVAL